MLEKVSQNFCIVAERAHYGVTTKSDRGEARRVGGWGEEEEVEEEEEEEEEEEGGILKGELSTQSAKGEGQWSVIC